MNKKNMLLVLLLTVASFLVGVFTSKYFYLLKRTNLPYRPSVSVASVEDVGFHEVVEEPSDAEIDLYEGSAEAEPNENAEAAEMNSSVGDISAENGSSLGEHAAEDTPNNSNNALSAEIEGSGVEIPDIGTHESIEDFIKDDDHSYEMPEDQPASESLSEEDTDDSSFDEEVSTPEIDDAIEEEVSSTEIDDTDLEDIPSDEGSTEDIITEDESPEIIAKPDEEVLTREELASLIESAEHLNKELATLNTGFAGLKSGTESLQSATEKLSVRASVSDDPSIQKTKEYIKQLKSTLDELYQKTRGAFFIAGEAEDDSQEIINSLKDIQMNLNETE